MVMYGILYSDLHILDFDGINVGEYISPIDPMGRDVTTHAGAATGTTANTKA